MRRFFPVLLTTIAFCSTGAWADETETPETATDAGAFSKLSLDEVIGKLNADRLADRLEAEKELLRRGSTLLDQLPPSELLPNASVREAVRRVRVQLERQKALDSLEASHVTLRGEFSLRELLDAVRKQTSNPFTADLSEEVAGQTLAVDFEKRPFWNVMDEIARRAKLRYNSGTGTAPLRVESISAEKNAWEKSTARTGPFWIGVRSATFRPLVGDEKKRRLLRVHAALAAEPRLRPLFLHYASKDLSLLTDNRTVLLPFTPEARYEVPLGNGGCWLELNFDFVVPAGVEPKFVRLNGLFKLLTAAGTEQFEFGDLTTAKEVSRRKGGVTVTFNGAQEKNAGEQRAASLDITVAYDVGGPAFDSYRTWVYYNEAYLTRPGRPRIEHDGGVSTRQQTDGAMSVSYGYTMLEEPLAKHRFIYKAPTLIVDVPVRFNPPAVPVD